METLFQNPVMDILCVHVDGIFGMSLGEDDIEEETQGAGEQLTVAAPDASGPAPSVPLLSAEMARRIMQLCWSKFEVCSQGLAGFCSDSGSKHLKGGMFQDVRNRGPQSRPELPI